MLLPGLPVKRIVLTLNWWQGLSPPLTTRRERFSPTSSSYTADSTHLEHQYDHYYKVVYEMAIMDYETGIKHTPQVSMSYELRLIGTVVRQ